MTGISIDEIRKNAPAGATHYRIYNRGKVKYYKLAGVFWSVWYFSKWKLINPESNWTRIVPL